MRWVAATLHHRHQIQPVLVATLSGKAAGSICDVLARAFVVAFPHCLHFGEKDDIAKRFECGGRIVLERQAIYQRTQLHDAFPTARAVYAYRGIIKEFKNQKLRSTIERLANFLLTQHEQSGARKSFTLPFEKKVLASRLGMAPEVLSRSFASLVPYKVSVRGANVEIGDVDALRKLAKPASTIDDAAV